MCKGYTKFYAHLSCSESAASVLTFVSKIPWEGIRLAPRFVIRDAPPINCNDMLLSREGRLPQWGLVSMNHVLFLSIIKSTQFLSITDPRHYAHDHVFFRAKIELDLVPRPTYGCSRLVLCIDNSLHTSQQIWNAIRGYPWLLIEYY